jgi:hypothetical protein
MMKVLLLGFVLLGACACTSSVRSGSPNSSDVAWLAESPKPSVLQMKVLADDSVHRVPAPELAVAIEMLEDSTVVALDEARLKRFPSVPQGLRTGDPIYLVRALVDDDPYLDISVYQDGPDVVVISGHRGSDCRPQAKGALIVRSRVDIKRAFGGCSSEL